MNEEKKSSDLINYEYWIKREDWQLEDAIDLLFGETPKDNGKIRYITGIFDIPILNKTNIDGKPLHKNNIRYLAVQSIKSHALKTNGKEQRGKLTAYFVTPINFCTWAIENRHKLPMGLMQAYKKLSAPKEIVKEINNLTITKKHLSIFDWDDFYSEHNAKIIENLLDQETTSVKEVFENFFPRTVNFESDKQNFDFTSIVTLKNLIDYFNRKFSTWREQLHPNILKGDMSFYPFSEIISNVKDIAKKIMGESPENQTIEAKLKLLDELSKPLDSNTFIYSDKILALLVEDGLLPQEICVLARQDPKDINFNIIHDYYPKLWQEYFRVGDIEKIIKSPENYSNMPATLTHEELIEFIKNNQILKSEVEIACKENRLGVYVRVNEEDISTELFTHSEQRSLDYFRKFNCGNPYYIKRYEGLEKLFVKKEDTGRLHEEESNISFDDLWRIGSMSLLLRASNGSFVHGNFLQTTDIETKFHIKRTLESFNGRKEIKVTDLLFLKNEVRTLLRRPNILESNQSVTFNIAGDWQSQLKQIDDFEKENPLFDIDMSDDEPVRHQKIHKLKSLESQELNKAWPFLKLCFVKTFSIICSGKRTEEYEIQSSQLNLILNEFNNMKPSDFLEMFYNFSFNILNESEKITDNVKKKEIFNAFFYTWKRELIKLDVNSRKLGFKETVNCIYRYLCNIYCALKYSDIDSTKFMEIKNDVDSAILLPQNINRQIENNFKLNETNQINSIQTTKEKEAINYLFLNKGDFYEIIFNGKKTQLHKSKGLKYIEHLLKNPGEKLHVSKIENYSNPNFENDVEAPQKENAFTIIAGESDSIEVNEKQFNVNDLIDDTTKNDCLIKIKELKDELDIAELTENSEEITRLTGEIETYSQYLNESTFDGKSRTFNDPGEKSRKRVWTCIKGALDKIKAGGQSDLYDHLKKFLKTGYMCIYNPVKNIEWKF